jgi:hypothetical protein
MAIAFFYALGTAAGGISGPLLFAKLINTGNVGDTAVAFLIGAVLMVAAGIVAAFLSLNAEQKSLEDVAEPLSSEQADRPTSGSSQLRRKGPLPATAR